jgi:hypothetical protein
MNKTQLITLLVALAIAGAIVGILSSRNHRHIFLRAHFATIGQELIASTNSSHLILIGPGLKERLVQLLALPTQIDATLLGDEPSPLGDGSATSRLILRNDKGERLGIRLRQDGDSDKFHVVGFWSPDVSVNR